MSKVSSNSINFRCFIAQCFSTTTVYIWLLIRKIFSLVSWKLRFSRSSNVTKTTLPWEISCMRSKPSSAIFKMKSFYRITTLKQDTTPTSLHCMVYARKVTTPNIISTKRSVQTTNIKQRSPLLENKFPGEKLRFFRVSETFNRNLIMLMLSERKSMDSVLSSKSWKRIAREIKSRWKD